MIVFRADANPSIGMGHIMRCLSLADAFHDFGYEVIFILADEEVKTMVNSRGYETIILHSDYARIDKESDWWLSVRPDIIIVDSYYVTPTYLHTLHQNAKLVYIDDLAIFPYPTDILVNYNAFGLCLDYHNLYFASGIREPYYIRGPYYAPLRSMFRNVKQKIQKEKVENVLISTGGADTEHIALKTVQSYPKSRNYHILLGNMNSDKEKIRELSCINNRIILHENVSDMKTLISNMDIAVSAAGSTLYEICACGVPLITYILADNQIPGAEAFAKLGLAINLGDLRGKNDPSEKILSSVETLAKDYDMRVRIGSQMQEMIDGLGAERMAIRILELIII